MKLNKKLFLLGAAALSLAACGNSGSADSSNGEGPITIEYWHPNADTQGGQAVTKLVEEFNASQDEIVVEATFNEGMYQGLMQNLQTAVASGDAPALVQIGWSYREYFANNFEYTEPQTVIEEYFPDDSEYLSTKFAENIFALGTGNDGRQVGTPYSLSVPVLYLNMDILNEAGVNPDDLTTWEAVEEAAKTISEKTDADGLYIAENADNWNIQAMIESNGGKVIGEDGKAAFAEQAGLDTYTFYQDMVNDGVALHAPNDQGQQAFISGQVGMAHMTIAQRSNVTSNSTFEAAAVASPAFEGQEANLPAGGSMLVMTAEEEAEQQAAWTFMKFLYEPDNVATWTESTGYVPGTVDATENAELDKLLNEDPIFSAANSSLDKMVPWAAFPGNSGLEAEQMLIDLRDRILGGADVETEVPATQDDINALID